MSLNSIKVLFCAAAAYDLILGALFGVAYQPIFERFGAALPNHPGYVELPALFIIIFGVGFSFVSRDPQRNRAIIWMGVLMKLAFAWIVLGHTFFGQSIPFLVPFAVADLVFAALFCWALVSLGENVRPAHLGRAVPSQ